MHVLTIYGTPEGQITVEGDFDGMFSAGDSEEGTFLAVSDGTLLALDIDEDQIWRMDAITLGAATEVQKQVGTVDSDANSDRLTLINPTAPFLWMLLGSSVVCAENALEGNVRE